MKKIFSTVAIAVALFAGYYAYNEQNKSEITGMALANVEALAKDNNADENQSAQWFVKTDDCSHTVTVGADGKVNIFGVIKVVDLEVGASYTESWKDVRTDCESGGKFLCTPYTCAQFIIDMTKISNSK